MWGCKNLSGNNVNSKNMRLVEGPSGNQARPVARFVATNATAAQFAGKESDEEYELSLEPEGGRILRHSRNISDVQYIYIGHPIVSMR